MDSSQAKNKVSVSASTLFSSSSPSIPCRPNPKSRNSETGDIMRRSFRGNPFPVDPSRQNSIGRESNRVEYGDKENQKEKDQISNVFRATKGAKNFMSPTISAVSKINPSPRKKILSDKNEVSRSFDKTQHQVRSSVSFSDVITIIEEDKDHEHICIDEKKQLEEESHDITVTDVDDNSENKSNDYSSFKISPLPPQVSYTFPVFESHEVDPSVAPYDPKKNYLSPRPQFLHYRPNPRIEHHFDECKKLEELFISESSSCETDLSAEGSQKEDEVASQEGVVAVEEKTQDENGKESVEEAETDEEEEEVVNESIEEETHQISTQSSFKTSRLLGWILALCVAYLLVVSSTTFSQPNIIKDLPFYEFHSSPQTITSARESFEQLSVKLRMWTESSLVYLDKLISSLREEKGYGPFKFYNLTDTLESKRLPDAFFQPTSGEISVGALVVDSQDWSLETDLEEENVGHQEPEEPENDGETSLEAVYEDDGNEFEQESKGGEVKYLQMVYEFDMETEINMETNTEMKGGERYSENLSEEENAGQETDGVEGQREYEENDQKNIERDHESETRSAQNDKQKMEESESDAHQLDDVDSAAVSLHQQKETKVSNDETISEEEEGIAGNSFGVTAEAKDNGNDLEKENGFGEIINDAGSEEILLSNEKKVIVLFSTLMVLLAAAASFLIAKKKAKPVMLLHEDGEPTIISDTKEVNIEHMPVENLIKERLSSQHIQEEEEVDDGRRREVPSLHSEMSFSFHKNKSFHSCNNRNDLKEDQRGGGRRKSNDSGESMASSASEFSMDSVSYGSFTTYEKVQKRSGHKEEEMITPVRRSSRIRKNQHSGQ